MPLSRVSVGCAIVLAAGKRTSVRPASGLQGHGVAIDVDHGAPGAPTARRSRGLDVVGIYVKLSATGLISREESFNTGGGGDHTEVTISLAVLRRVAIQATDDTRENAELLAGVVAYDPDLDPDTSVLGLQLQGCDRHVLDRLGVEPQETKVVDRVAIDRVDVALA